MPVALGVLPMGEEALRHDEMQIVLRAGHRDIEQPAFLLELGRGAGAEIGGMQPSTAFRTKTAFHSCPFAEWIVDRIR